MKNWREHIESKPDVLYGKPLIKATRIPVDLILEKLSNGETIEDLLKAYPNIKREHVFSVLAFASATVRNEVVHCHL